MTQTLVWLWTIGSGLVVLIAVLIFSQSFRTHRYRVKHEMPNGDSRRLLHEHMRSAAAFGLVGAIYFYVGLRFLIGFNFGAIGYLFVVAVYVMLFALLAKFRDRRLLSRSSR